MYSNFNLNYLKNPWRENHLFIWRNDIKALQALQLHWLRSRCRARIQYALCPESSQGQLKCCRGGRGCLSVPGAVSVASLPPCCWLRSLRSGLCYFYNSTWRTAPDRPGNLVLDTAVGCSLNAACFIIFSGGVSQGYDTVHSINSPQQSIRVTSELATEAWAPGFSRLRSFCQIVGISRPRDASSPLVTITSWWFISRGCK